MPLLIYFFHHGRQKGEKVMEKIKKNNVSGLYELQLGTHLFNSEDQNHFKFEFDKFADILITELPLNVNFEHHIPEISIDKIVNPVIDTSEPEVPNLTLTRKNSTTVEICVTDEVYQDVWFGDISLDYYINLLVELIKAQEESKNLQFLDCSGGRSSVEVIYKIKLTSTKIGEAFKEAVNIHNSMIDRINIAAERGCRYIRQLVLSGFQIDVSHLLSGPKQSNKDSKV